MKTKVVVGIIFVILSLICIFVSLIRKKESFFNIMDVVKNHLKLFKSCPYQYVIFYVFPLLFAIGLVLIYQAGESFYSELSVVIGIILSILMAILSIISGYNFSNIKDEGQRKRANDVLAETINAIVFNSLLCVFMMLYALSMIVIDGVDFSWIKFDTIILESIASGIAYYVFSVILLTLLLIVKHMSNMVACNRKMD